MIYGVAKCWEMLENVDAHVGRTSTKLNISESS